jgi:hypothetical protein
MSGGIGCRLASSGFGLVAMHVERSMRIKRSVASGSAAGSAGGRAKAARESGHRMRRRSRRAHRGAGEHRLARGGAGGHRRAEPRSIPVRTLEDAEVDSPFDLSWSLDGTGPWREG